MRVAAGLNCIQPSAPGYRDQISLELSIKRQKLPINGEEYFVTVLGGASSNARGPLSAYELQPILRIGKMRLDDTAAISALTEYVDRTVVLMMKAATRSR